MFIQVHTLTSYPASLLNRDDAGFAKTIPFGGVTRTRVSSQCLKKHWREVGGKAGLANLGNASLRSRQIFRRRVAEPLIAAGKDATRVIVATYVLMEYSSSKKFPGKRDINDLMKLTVEDQLKKLHQKQVTVFGPAEVKYFRNLVSDAADAAAGETKNTKVRDAILKWFKSKEKDTDIRASIVAAADSMGIDAALFGRMVTSEIAAQGHAAVHVAHAMTTHAGQTESDYLTAVDILDPDNGAGTLQSIQLTSGVFYGYFAIDVPLLVANLEGLDSRKNWKSADHTLAKDVIARLIRAASTTSPGAKLGSTAPYSYSGFVMTEVGKAQPCQLADAFLEPVSLENKRLMQNSAKTLLKHARQMDRMYKTGNDRFVAFPIDVSNLINATQTNVPDLAIKTAEAIA